MRTRWLLLVGALAWGTLVACSSSTSAASSDPCGELAVCCETLATAEGSLCAQVVASGVTGACSSQLSAYTTAQACTVTAVTPDGGISLDSGRVVVTDGGTSPGKGIDGGTSPGKGSDGGGGGAKESGAPACSSEPASGFAATPTSFAIPAPTCQVDFDSLGSGGYGAVGYSALDLNGDAFPDLVVYSSTCDTTLGQTHWDVYGGSAAGFAATPTSFAIPAPTCQVDFDSLGSGGYGAVGYSVLDLNGDTFPDLVVYSSTCDPTLGQTHWDVYGGSAAGFAATPTSFAIPAPTCQVDFDSLGSGGYGAVGYSVLDLDGDAFPDLVVYSSTCDPTLGQTHWDVYGGSAAGFAATPTSFAIPAPTCQVDFDSLGSGGYGAVGYSVLDLNGDAFPDLVVYSSTCDTTLGQTHWNVYAGSAAGFAATPTSFAIPTPTCQVDFDSLGSGGYGAVGYSVLDLNGDAFSDLVVYSSTCDTTLGQTHWNVYAGSAAGFAATPTSFAIPTPTCQVDFDSLGSGGYGAVGYSVLKLTNSCTTSLVVFDDSCDTTIGKTHWDVYGQK